MSFGPAGNGRFLGSGGPRGPQNPFKNMRGFAPHIFEWFLGPPGPPRPRKSAISARPKTHVLKTKAYSKSRSNYELRASKQQNEDGKQQRTSGRFIIHGIFVRGSPRIKPRRETLQGGFCQQKHRHRNTDPKIGPGGKEHRSETQGKPTTNPQNRQKLRDPARS
jgi:hypothetical protein